MYVKKISEKLLIKKQIGKCIPNHTIRTLIICFWGKVYRHTNKIIATLKSRIFKQNTKWNIKNCIINSHI